MRGWYPKTHFRGLNPAFSTSFANSPLGCLWLAGQSHCPGSGTLRYSNPIYPYHYSPVYIRVRLPPLRQECLRGFLALAASSRATRTRLEVRWGVGEQGSS